MRIRMNIDLDTDNENDRNILAIFDSTNLLSMISRVGDEGDIFTDFLDLEIGEGDDTRSEGKEESS